MSRLIGVLFTVLFMMNSYATEVLQDETADAIRKYFVEEGFKYKTDLCEIMTRHGSDKGNGHHNYTTLYSALFDRLRDCELNIFELGLGTNHSDVPSNMGPSGVPGASLFGWAEYFAHSHIYGADIDRRILFSTDRIKTYYCDQRSEKSVQAMYKSGEPENATFDIIIEDGLHTFSAGMTFLLNSLDRLKKGGFFIIEDVNSISQIRFREVIFSLQREFALSYIFFDDPNRWIFICARRIFF